EAFYRRALLENVKAASFGWLGGARPGMEFKGDANTPPPPDSAPRFAGHFAGMMLDASKVDFSDQKWVIPGPSVGGGMVSLEALEGGSSPTRRSAWCRHSSRPGSHRFRRNR